jgi:hypothetical protein
MSMIILINSFVGMLEYMLLTSNEHIRVSVVILIWLRSVINFVELCMLNV